MYLRIDHSGNKVEIQEHFKRPMVYLDHWAYSDISLCEDLKKTFVEIMNSYGGTLRLSVVNITEIAKQKDEQQINSILNLIKSINDCGFINLDPKEVIKKENLLVADPNFIIHVQNPSAELDIVTAYLMAHNSPLEWHVSDIIKSVIKELPSKRLDESNNNFLVDMQRILTIGRNDEKHLSRAKARFSSLKQKGPRYQIATRELLRMALDFVMRNKNMKMLSYSEWNDLFHLIVPVSYCDIVLMDKRWKTFIDQTSYSSPNIAMVYDKRKMSDFLKAIENWEKT